MSNKQSHCVKNGPTRELARWAAQVRSEDIPADALSKAQEFFLDWVGAALAGSAEPLADIAYSVMEPVVPELRTSTALKEDFGKCSPLQAAFINGFNGHILELDDVHRGAVFHPATVVIPAALSFGEKIHASGKKVLEAIVIGYEVCIRVGQAAGGRHYEKWHTTGTCATFGAAAAVGRLLGLDELKMAWALGNAGTQAAGLWQFLEDAALTKPLHPGKASFNGMLAALMAEKGFSGPTRILEGKKGFLSATSPDYDLTQISDRLGEIYQIRDVSIKPYPSCRHSHAQIDAAREIARRPGFDASKVEKIRVLTYPTAIAVAGGKGEYPASSTEAKFNSPYCIAIALQTGSVRLPNFEQNVIESNKHAEYLVNHTTIEIGDEFEERFPAAWGARVEVRMEDGAVLDAEVKYPKGDPENPLTSTELYEKYADLAKVALDDTKTALVGKRIMHLEQVSDISDLFEA